MSTERKRDITERPDPYLVDIWRRVLRLRRRGRDDLAENLNSALKAMIVLSARDAQDEDEIARIAGAIVEAAK